MLIWVMIFFFSRKFEGDSMVWKNMELFMLSSVLAKSPTCTLYFRASIKGIVLTLFGQRLFSTKFPIIQDPNTHKFSFSKTLDPSRWKLHNVSAAALIICLYICLGKAGRSLASSANFVSLLKKALNLNSLLTLILLTIMPTSQ